MEKKLVYLEKAIDLSVLVASGVIVADGAMKVVKAVKAKSYAGLLMTGLGIAVGVYAFKRAMENINASKEVAPPDSILPADEITE